MIMCQYRCAFGLCAALMCGLTLPARAEVRVEGTPAAVRVTTSQDAISDVLAAFAVTFKVRYRTSVPLDEAASTTYSGSFGQVVSRLLDGYNYVIKADQEATEIVVLGRRGAAAMPPAAPKPAPAKSVASQWR